ncbi:MAG: peptidyl-prolyl cis-trans isomerase [Kiritimatiellae bacterium]|nr:peptidyl-prolyl cis-trans isomerase [Kiritimatiellia bacterium]
MKWRCSIVLPLVLLALASPRGAAADTLRLVNGRVYEGEVVVDGKENIVFHTEGSYITVDRSEIESLDRTTREEKPPPRNVGAWETDIPRFTATVYVEQGPLEGLLVRVGQGGITRTDYKLYLMARARELNKKWNELDTAERQQALQKAIDDEILFQAALAAGIHSQQSMRQIISARYQARHVDDLIKPESFSVEDRRAFYEANKKAFMMPPGVRVKIRTFAANASREEVNIAWEAARAAPATLAGWKDFGWIMPDTEKDILSRQDVEYLLTLATGQVSKVITDLYGASFFFWVNERQEAEARSYEEMEKEILERMMEDRRLELQAKFDREIEQARGGLSPEEAVFQRALEVGIHRDWAVRQRIIELYVAAKKADRGDLLADLRRNYPVSRVEEE